MKKLNKALSAVMTAALLLSVVSCSGGGDSPAAETTAAAGSTAVSAETTSAAPTLGLPEDLDFKGRTVTVFACNEEVPYTYFELAEQNGDTLNDSLYERNSLTEERLNVKLAINQLKGIQMFNPVQASVMAGDHAFDIINPHILAAISQMVVGGLLYELNGLPNVDFEKPWWNSGFTDTLSIKDKLFYASGDIVVPNARVIVFNKQMIKSLGKADVYKNVNDGKWTLDKLGEYTKGVVSDTDGDGVLGQNDRYAFSDLSNTGLATSFVHGSGLLFVEKDGDSYKFNMTDEKMYTVTEKLFEYLYREGNTKITNENFGNGTVLFGSQVLLKLQILRAYDTDFGIIPFPKFDETQDGYYSSVWNGLICVPADVTDAACVGAVLEAMACYSSETLMPAYKEQLLASKFARDAESGEMLELIFDGLVNDFGLCFDNFKGYYASVGKVLNAGNTDLTSFFAANESVYKAHYDELFAAVK